MEDVYATEENMQHFKTWNFIVSYFVGNFCPPGSGSSRPKSMRIWIWIHIIWICIPKALFHRPTFIHTNSLFYHRQFFFFLMLKPDPHSTLYLLAYLWSSPWLHWRCRIMVSTGPLSLTMGSPSQHSYEHIPKVGGLWHLPTLEMTLNLG